MKHLNEFIIEKLKINKDTKVKTYSEKPETWEELRNLLYNRLIHNPNADLNDIDVSNLKSLRRIFNDLNPMKIDISEWDVSNCEDMGFMFSGCEDFECDLSYWDVSNVKNMEYMFANCESFDSCCIENWDVKSLKNMKNIFYAVKYSVKKLPSWYKES